MRKKEYVLYFISELKKIKKDVEYEAYDINYYVKNFLDLIYEIDDKLKTFHITRFNHYIKKNEALEIIKKKDSLNEIYFLIHIIHNLNDDYFLYYNECISNIADFTILYDIETTIKELQEFI